MFEFHLARHQHLLQSVWPGRQKLSLVCRLRITFYASFDLKHFEILSFFLRLSHWLHVYHDRAGGEGEFLENTIRISLPKGLPLGIGEICVDFWDFWRGVPEVAFLLLLSSLVWTKTSKMAS